MEKYNHADSLVNEQNYNADLTMRERRKGQGGYSLSLPSTPPPLSHFSQHKKIISAEM